MDAGRARVTACALALCVCAAWLAPPALAESSVTPDDADARLDRLLRVANHNPANVMNRAHVKFPTLKLLRHVSAVDGMGVSDDARAYGSATYHCTSAHGPACPARGAVGELANPASPDDDDLEEEDDAVVIMHAAHVGGDVDVAQIMRMFENGAFDEALGRAKRKKNGNPEAKAEPEPEAAKRHDVAAAKRFFRARDNEHETDDVPTLARYGVTGEALPNDAATTWPSGVRSTPSRETRKVEFLNARSSTTAVYWVDFDGKETHYVDLPPGMSTLMSTFATHSWVARDMASARAIAVFTVQPRAESRSGSNTDQERPRRFVVVDAAERDMASDDASETLVKTRREIPAPAPAEPTKPEKQTKQTKPEKEPTDMQSGDRGSGGGKRAGTRIRRTPRGKRPRPPPRGN